jgi:RPA family protein
MSHSKMRTDIAYNSEAYNFSVRLRDVEHVDDNSWRRWSMKCPYFQKGTEPYALSGVQNAPSISVWGL